MGHSRPLFVLFKHNLHNTNFRPQQDFNSYRQVPITCAENTHLHLSIFKNVLNYWELTGNDGTQRRALF